MKMNNAIRIEDSLEITLEWSSTNTDKEAFLYLVAFKLTKEGVNDLHDIIYKEETKEDGLEYFGIKKSTYSTSSRLIQKLKLNTKEIRNAIEDIIFLLFSFKVANIARGKLKLRFDGKLKDQEYELSNQYLCIEFGRMKRCSNYWELYLDTMKYKSIETPYGLFAKILKNAHPAKNVFSLEASPSEMERKTQKAEEREALEETSGIDESGKDAEEAIPLNKKKGTYGTMPTSKKIKNGKPSTNQSNNKNDDSPSVKLTKTGKTSVKTVTTDDLAKTNKKNTAKGTMPYKKKRE